MKNDSVIENYKDDMCTIQPKIKSMKAEEIVAQIKQIQVIQYNTNVKNRKSTITLPIHLEENSHG